MDGERRTPDEARVEPMCFGDDLWKHADPDAPIAELRYGISHHADGELLMELVTREGGRLELRTVWLQRHQISR